MPQLLTPSPDHHYHFVTGRLAEVAVRNVVDALSKQHSFSYSIGVMPITVAALMTPHWLRRKLKVPAGATHLILPGYCQRGIEELSETLEIPVICGPKDCRALPEFFGGQQLDDDFGDYDIQIIAEINHAPRLSIDEVVRQASELREVGADIIDFGCDPVAPCKTIRDYIAALVDQGLTVSVDTFDPSEAAAAAGAGASLVLSVNSSNRQQAVDWGVEVVAIPDSPNNEKSLDETVDFLAKQNVPMRLDPILEPIGAGFAKSLIRYASLRRRHPDAEMMMGIGNLTELSDVDSAGVNLMLIGICQELQIRSVLTTQVINWARSCVKECDVARRLAHYAVKHRVPPKRLSDELVMLRDAELRPFAQPALDAIAKSLKDNNYRIFAQDQQIQLIAAGLQLSNRDPFQLFDDLLSHPQSDNVDPGHAFYLGYEMAKASIALTLGKQYEQDQALDWGVLTVEEDLHRVARTSRHRKRPTD